MPINCYLTRIIFVLHRMWIVRDNFEHIYFPCVYIFLVIQYSQSSRQIGSLLHVGNLSGCRLDSSDRFFIPLKRDLMYDTPRLAWDLLWSDLRLALPAVGPLQVGSLETSHLSLIY